MPTQGISMRKIKTVLRLYHESKLSQREIARSVQLSVGAVNKYLSKAAEAGLGWPLPIEYEDDALLQKKLYVRSNQKRLAQRSRIRLIFP